MKIKALIAFTARDALTGKLTSVACGQIVDADDDFAEELISDGLAEAYKLVEPTGTKTITANANDIDVTLYAKADVNVPNPSSGTLNITENGTYDVTEKASAEVNVADKSLPVLKSVIDRTVASIVIPDGTETVGRYIFSNCRSLESVTIPDSVVVIDGNAFEYCILLEEIVTRGVKTVGANAFKSCTALKSVDFGEDTERLYENVFLSATSLESLVVRSQTPPTLSYNSLSGVPNTLQIYVPSDSVNAYKSAQYWSDLALQIQAIPTT